MDCDKIRDNNDDDDDSNDDDDDNNNNNNNDDNNNNNNSNNDDDDDDADRSEDSGRALQKNEQHSSKAVFLCKLRLSKKKKMSQWQQLGSDVLIVLV